MAGKIPDEIIQAIRDRVSIVEVISAYVSLKKAGRNYLGLCPFHNEKTPSFTVNDERGLFHCFGCGVGGTVFTFVMKMERLEFPEAVANLARRAGVTLPERRDDAPGAQHREQLLRVNNFAAEFYRRRLMRPEGERARRYLDERGVAAEIAERFGLGFAPADGTALVRALAKKGVPETLALELGLLARANDGRLYDRFRGRLMFPIRHSDGRVIGFGGRVLDGQGPKYLNSPESVLFRKGEGVYGLAEARAAIRDADRVVLVEGYLDALALVQRGIAHTVASLGTALTVAQLRLVRRFTRNVVAFFDGDAAGQKAAERAFALCAEAHVWALGAFLPSGFDPDSFARQHGVAATQQLLDGAVPLFDFYLGRIDPGSHAPVPARARAAAEVARVLSLVRDPFEYDLLVRQAAERLSVSEQSLRKPAAIATRVTTPAGPAAPVTPAAPAEETLLVETMALDRDVTAWVERRALLEKFRSPELLAAAQQIAHAWQTNRTPASVVDALPPAIGARITEGLLGAGPIAASDRLKIAEDCAAKIEGRARRELAKVVGAELRRAEQQGDGERWRAELQRGNELLRSRGGQA
ncbi:MAG TPA: DNA primase [Candidatus Binatia bacterium]|nr:DNA primase [Candidatus Binatia bacterium]